MICPKCGSENVQVQTMSENLGSSTVSKTKSEYKEKKHSIIWWIFIGFWWWIVDLLSWVFLFVPRLVIRLFVSPYKKKKFGGQATTVTKSVNNIRYVTICTCCNCGNHWSVG